MSNAQTIDATREIAAPPVVVWACAETPEWWIPGVVSYYLIDEAPHGLAARCARARVRHEAALIDLLLLGSPYLRNVFEDGLPSASRLGSLWQLWRWDLEGHSIGVPTDSLSVQIEEAGSGRSSATLSLFVRDAGDHADAPHDALRTGEFINASLDSLAAFCETNSAHPMVKRDLDAVVDLIAHFGNPPRTPRNRWKQTGSDPHYPEFVCAMRDPLDDSTVANIIGATGLEYVDGAITDGWDRIVGAPQ